MICVTQKFPVKPPHTIGFCHSVQFLPQYFCTNMCQLNFPLSLVFHLQNDALLKKSPRIGKCHLLDFSGLGVQNNKSLSLSENLPQPLWGQNEKGVQDQLAPFLQSKSNSQAVLSETCRQNREKRCKLYLLQCARDLGWQNKHFHGRSQHRFSGVQGTGLQKVLIKSEQTLKKTHQMGEIVCQVVVS